MTSSAVVCYCSVGYRSSDMASKLYQQAKATGQASDLKLYNLEGGIFQWASEGREMVDQTGQKTALVHPYSSVWGYLVPSQLRSTL